MFGMSLPEILIIAIIAVLFLGPDKLPEAMVQIAKFFKTVKKGVNDAKASFESEIKIAELKEDAQKYKQSLEEATSTVRKKLTFEELDEIKKNLNSGAEAINKGLNTIKNPVNAVKDELKNLSKEQILTPEQNKSELAQNGGRRAARMQELSEQTKADKNRDSDKFENLSAHDKPSAINELEVAKNSKTAQETYRIDKFQTINKSSENSEQSKINETSEKNLKKGASDV
ncbi:hypothetical protein LBC_11290 [Campylobacter sp. 19-13652]|nr:hypothetical protein LBC_11290 [Campylobacter sp. 19-13652]